MKVKLVPGIKKIVEFFVILILMNIFKTKLSIS